MDEAVCRNCGGKFPKSEVFSWGICKKCDKAKGVEVRKLRFRRQAFGILAMVTFVGIVTLLLSYVVGPNQNGYYTLPSKLNGPQRITYGFLWWMMVTEVA